MPSKLGRVARQLCYTNPLNGNQNGKTSGSGKGTESGLFNRGYGGSVRAAGPSQAVQPVGGGAEPR